MKFSLEDTMRMVISGRFAHDDARRVKSDLT
jgi:hypothetical protein